LELTTTQQIMEIALQLGGLSNIPADSGIWVPGSDVRRILFGIDVGAAEIEIARRLGYDLVIAHHPPEATLQAWKEYLRHIPQMVAAGISPDEAEQAVADHVEAMQLGAHARNDQHTVSVARLIGMPFMNIHTPLDEIGRQRVQSRLDSLASAHPGATAGDVLRTLQEFGEVKSARVSPMLAVGSAEAPAGRSVFAHGALDIPNYAMLKAYYAHGIHTMLTLRTGYADLVRLRREQLGTLIVVGHMAGDSLGFTPFLSALRQLGLEVTTFSGVIEP
jgi:hypothetical protein